ncbi:preprotein translocase subunit SecA [Candidatus Saccharibacteria bacterium RIFCSPHIGHO2_12_FULL_41_12]|nr:MAG: preprotein translocase subunit SecA [Candidatus Saccharibacteria bacterium RIFCSPHIGHO2_12_FULL_41_12]
MKKVLKKVLGDPGVKRVKQLTKRVKNINVLAPKYLAMSDKELKKQTEILKKRLEKESLDKILPDAFALVREASVRTLKMRHFDVQLVGGMALHQGTVAEMKTGEGKTLVATLPVYLNALTGKGVHVVTVNEYLAQRDAGWMGQIYDFLGLSIGVIIAEESFMYDSTYDNKDHDDPRMRKLKSCTRQEAYRADITYGTNNEYGFDYLRDNMVRDESQLRQRELNFAIVDEVDSILIDEARTPLIISSSSQSSSSAYEQFARIARQLERDKHYEVDEKRRETALNDDGVDLIEKILGVKHFYTSENIRSIYHMEQALKAEALFHRDKEYVVTGDGEIVIVDEHTGRLLKGRRYNEGLHQAIEAKEGVEIQEESMTLATITFQNYFRLYEKLSGMTGTAATEAEEFHMIYKLDVLEIPSNKKLIREDMPDKIYKNEIGKFKSIIELVKELHKKGQPVLIGSASIEKNEALSKFLTEAKIPHQILNAKNNEREATIIAKAGQKGAVTLATNIAGRGTDIVLDEDAKKAGGLFVLGSERHESRRIDNQLRGRSGRQGDAGKTQFFVSCEDDLMRIFGGDKILGLMNRLKVDDTTPVQNRTISKSLEGAQEKVEGFNFDMRKNVVKYDDVMNRHRRATYSMRREILHNPDISPRVKQFLKTEAEDLANSPMATTKDYEEFLRSIFPLDDNVLDRLFDLTPKEFEKELIREVDKLYIAKEKEFGEETFRKVERDIYFQLLDEHWMEHLENMDYLKQGIHWVGVAQRDPLVEYRKQSQKIFENMQLSLRSIFAKTILRIEAVDVETEPVETELTLAAKHSVDNADRILHADSYAEEDFSIKQKSDRSATKKQVKNKKKARKAERTRKSKARKRK